MKDEIGKGEISRAIKINYDMLQEVADWLNVPKVVLIVSLQLPLLLWNRSFIVR